jgi:DNA phosphorothioation-associated putative methyltransferase
MQFPGAPKYHNLPKSLQADIKAFFRSHSAALEEGRKTLFAAGDRDALRRDIKAAVTEGNGGMRGDHWFRFRSPILHLLPTRIRVLVGCAEVLQGGVDACDFVDIDLTSPRIAMVTCDDLDHFVPSIVERVTVDLARQKVSANKFEINETPLYFKSRYMSRDEEVSAAQTQFEQALAATGLFIAGHTDPPWYKVKSALSAR